MLVGEQPGDDEDRAGEPFVGPAGQLLDRALADAGVPPESVFVTNVVKHFRWSGTRGKRRIHQSPSRVHVAACGPWLVAELSMVRPRGIVLLGGTAGKAVFGTAFRVGESRAAWRTGRTTSRGRLTRRRPRTGCCLRCIRQRSCARGSGTRTTAHSSTT